MKVTKVFSQALGAISRLIAIIYSWLGILFDWTDEVKVASDDTLKRYKAERVVDNQIADAKLEKEIKQKLEDAGLT